MSPLLALSPLGEDTSDESYNIAGTPEGVSRVVVGDKVTAGLEQDGKLLASLEHEMIAREGGYQFNPDL